ncbi:hypothetical protein [Hymenobacter properus]|uniref:LemA family protein n=1 Tax=Hymenobacter properus TaxID=2791026 RepID=A0A931FJN1_9BACT|nr:hypothetical protein [Hymenobacter properus]MBF9140715.1 hypothetical protein [Hymenobacter properus]MBR7719523.1 hypothetical protein [Microvirga sp. SRT04]
MANILISPVKTLAVALLVLAACAASCKRDGSKSVVLNPAAATEVKAQLDILQDSVNAKWRNMTESDDQKIGVTRLLLRELKAQPGANAAQLQALDQANNRLKARRYTQQTMASSELIDQYDAAQDSLLKAVYPVAAPNGAAPTENARNFVEGIQQLDANVVGLRVQYDHAVHQYNDYLKLHQAELQQLGGKYTTLKPLSFFTIGAQ